MRIIAGTFRGRRLSTIHDRSIRPTTDRAKQVIFDVLTNRMDFSGIAVLDLFSGSGSLGLEALSRGAGSVTFVEKAPSSIAVLEKNIRSLGCDSQSTVHQVDVFWFLGNMRRTFDLIFVDPPYRMERIGELPSAIAGSRVIRTGTTVVMEHSRESAVPVPETFAVTNKQLGQTTVLFLTVLSPEDFGKETTHENRHLSGDV